MPSLILYTADKDPFKLDTDDLEDKFKDKVFSGQKLKGGGGPLLRVG